MECLTCSKKLLKLFCIISSLIAVDKDRCRSGGSRSGRVCWLRGHRRRPACAAAAADVNVGGGGGGREQKTPPLKVLWQFGHNHLASLVGLVIPARSYETSRLQSLQNLANSPHSLLSNVETQSSN